MGERIESTHVVHVELDALLDTRIATVARIRPKQAAKLLHPDYRARHSDQFSKLVMGLTDEEYQQAYRKRGFETLQLARPTDIVVVLSDIVKDLQSQLDNGSPIVQSVKVEVNYWPYDLTFEEVEEFRVAVKELCQIMADVEMVSLPLGSLNYEWIRASKYSVMVIYNWQEWFLEAHRGYTERPVGCPRVTMIAPALVVDSNELRSDKKFYLPNGRYVDPFDATTMNSADLIGFNFLAASAFSLLNPSEMIVGDEPSVSDDSP